jgi:pectinesterase
MLSRILFLVIFLIPGLCLKAQDNIKITVAHDGSGDFKTIQSAIDACKSFPPSRITIFIKNGVYHEKIRIPACNTRINLTGEDKEKTVISFDDFFSKVNRGPNSTFYTYTLLVEADDCVLSNLKIENTSGPVGQAVALHISGNRCAVINCNIIGNQDTLYATGELSCQYFKGCYIEGTTDFIFGSATALFDDCTIHSQANSFITAANTQKGKKYGFVFLNCKLTAAQGINSVFLGRPWRDYANVVFMKCNLGSHILSQGWSNWDNTTRDRTAFFAEFQNMGAGSDTARRVKWSRQLTPSEAEAYTPSEILKQVILTDPALKTWINN